MQKKPLESENETHLKYTLVKGLFQLGDIQ